MTNQRGLPVKQGLYNPEYEKDNCGVGFIANITGVKSNEIVKKGIEILVNLTHRGAVGADPNTGDGAGIMIQIPDEFFRKNCEDIKLPSERDYAVGMIFLPKEPALRYQCEGIVERMVELEGHEVLGWRTVPTNSLAVGETARGTEPTIRQVFISKDENKSNNQFEKDLYIARKKMENEVLRVVKKETEYFYVCSLSSKTIVYKGLLLPEQIEDYFKDFEDDSMISSMALVHSRFSTNTFPTWDLAHPFRFIAHNGEINTIRGNRNWMNAREGVLESDVFGKRIKETFPVLSLNASDSASLDNMFEMLKIHDVENAHCLMTLVPEAWQNDPIMSKERRAFYEYHSTMIEPWDGPAAVFFCDGDQVGATLDRSGLRPAKYVITKEDQMIMASELGVLEIDSNDVVKKGRLEPGKMLYVDVNEKKLFEDLEIKEVESRKRDYIGIMEKNKVTLDMLESNESTYRNSGEKLKEKQQAFGYTQEDTKRILSEMANLGKEPIGAMGNDTPLAVLSNKPQMMYSYFRQLFAQVTNPPIDPIRENIVMSLINYIGSQKSILGRNPYDFKALQIETPVLSNEDFSKIKSLRNEDFKTTNIPITFKADSGIDGFKMALDLICKRASRRVAEGYTILVLTDKKVDGYEVAIPSLLAVSAVHHHLIKEKTRTKVSIIVESGDARETTHMALLVGYGASAINPYLAIESVKDLYERGELDVDSEESACDNYLNGLRMGLKKILSKMGICTVQSYQGAQIFESLGLGNDLVSEYFPGTPSRIGGIGIEEIAKETLDKHKKAFNRLRKPNNELEIGGIYTYRKNGEKHLFSPESIFKLQVATKKSDYKMFKEYSKTIDNQSEALCTLRGMLKFTDGNESVPLNEVEPVSEIVKRFVSGAMSFGSLSKEVHEAIAIAMNRIGGKSNSGEGGEDPSRYTIDENGDDRRSAVKQVASGRFGVNTNYMVNADELQIKVAQGAKPGEGGHLPGKKVNAHIAKVRHSTPGIGLISPPPHHDIYSIEDLAQLIYDLKSTNPKADVSVKLVSEVGIGTIAAGVAKAHADLIVISGHDGGTGASPLSSMTTAGVPWELGLSETHQVLLLNNLRGKVKLQTDGQLKTGRDVVIASLLGAEEFGFATTSLVVMGCVMLRHCNLNNCDLGIATQDPELRKNFKGKPEYLINFMTYIAQEVREYMAELGFRNMDEMVGRVDKLEVNKEVNHWKASKLDFSKILYKPDMPKRINTYCVEKQDHNLSESFDMKLIEASKQSLEDGSIKTETEFSINNTNRSAGAMLSGQIVSKYGEMGLPEDTIKFKFNGSAGQSFGAFTTYGVTLLLNGDANDYVGKGLSGGKLIVKTPKEASYVSADSCVAGNTILYGATAGKVFINGKAGERFGVRNSGAEAVVEGVGNHGCEYMTGGVVVVLGSVGKNFGAGMSGGQAFIYDPKDELLESFNSEIASVEILTEKNVEKLKDMITEHVSLTNSPKGKSILENWEDDIAKFKRVVASDYKAIVDGDTVVELKSELEDDEKIS